MATTIEATLLLPGITEAQMNSENPILLKDEIRRVIGKGVKIGDGVTGMKNLPYAPIWDSDGVDFNVLANHGYANGEAVKTVKQLETLLEGKKAEHGYDEGETPKTVKEVDQKLQSIDILVRSGKWYGIEWKDGVASSAATRIGNLDLHRQLPIQNNMKRCLLRDDGTVNYYTDANNTLVKNEVEMESSALDGQDGQVMVEIPQHYRRFDKDGLFNRVLISEQQLPGFHLVPKQYISAYEATLDRTNPDSIKLASVVNINPEFRGGNNTAAWDETYRSLLGVPATNQSLLKFREYARNRGTAGLNGAGWNCNLYQAAKAKNWLYFIEYANFDSQLAFNANNDALGFKQGGLGAGVTNLSSAEWSEHNSYNPFVPCGHTNSLGNKTGVVKFNFAEGSAITKDIYVPSYRGIENPFGHIWEWTDGVMLKLNSDALGGEFEVYVCNNPANFHSTDFSNYTKVGVLPASGGYIKELLVGEFGEISPKATGGSSTTYFTDYFYRPAKPEADFLIKGVLLGGGSDYGSDAGLSATTTAYNLSYPSAVIGSRLCFLPSA